MNELIYGVKIFLFCCFLIGYFILFKYIEEECQKSFNYQINSAGMKFARLGLIFNCFGYFMFSHSKSYIFYSLLILIVMFIKDLKNTNLKYAGILLVLNIVGTFIIGLIYLIYAFVIALLFGGDSSDERYR